jgi:hypothetical protein
MRKQDQESYLLNFKDRIGLKKIFLLSLFPDKNLKNNYGKKG